MEMFFIDESRDIKKSYSDLIKDINSKKTIRKYIFFQHPYDIFLELIHSLVLGKNVELLDYDFSINEIKSLGIQEQNIYFEEEVEKVQVNNYMELIKIINKNRDKWKISLYTSGTTGRPKKVIHSLDSIIRNLKKGSRFESDIWAFAYNPTHFAGLQVFFQAFLNMNTLVYIFDYKKKKLEDIFLKYNITNISATPTFYRTIIPYFVGTIETVKRVTLGGEKFDPTLSDKLERIFPNAKIRNIYASTEAGSLFGSECEVFEIKPQMKEYIKISEENELLIHKRYLGYSNQYQLEEGEWYKTGDIIEFIDNNKFRFVSRNTEMINIGGYKVNPHEIEEAIKEIDEIVDVVVKGKSNKITGNILIAEIVIKDDAIQQEIEDKIYKELGLKFQRWKIPRIIKFIDSINKTRTGKKARK